MKTYLASAGILALGFVAPAIAADLPVKPPAATAVLSDWSGFYLGVHGGYGWGHSPLSQPFGGLGDLRGILGTIDSRGALVGAHAGYNWQYGRIVAGLEADFSAANIKGTTSTTLFDADADATGTLQDQIKYFGSARARLGALPVDNVLLYGTAGVAWQRLERTETIASTLISIVNVATSHSTSTTTFNRFGWVTGAGAEGRLFGSSWVGRIEYLHYDFDRGNQRHSIDLPTGLPASDPAVTSGRHTIDVIRAGLSYQFGPMPGTATAAMAAAHPVKAASSMTSGWSGFYLGAHGGYAWGHNPFGRPEFGPDNTFGILRGFDSGGAVFGSHAGHNWQYGRIVAGLEADFSVADIRGDTSLRLISPDEVEAHAIKDRAKYLGTVRARLGMLATDNALLYGTAGLGWQRLERTDVTEAANNGNGFINTVTTALDRFGWVAGAGGEARLPGSNWIGRVEYLHYDFGRFARTEAFQTIDGAVTIDARGTSGRQSVDVVRAGLSYKFAPAPGPASAAMALAHPTLASSDWGGFYLGVHGGYGWGRSPLSEPAIGIANTTAVLGDINSRGAMFGAHAGYNLQYGRMVAGLEIDFSAANIKGASSVPLSTPGETITTSLRDRIDTLGSVRARVGVLPSDGVLVYGTAGLGWERLERTNGFHVIAAGAPVVSATQSMTQPLDRFGWVAGAGAEATLFGSNWLGRIEYLHYDFGRGDQLHRFQDFNGVVTEQHITSGGQTVDILRAGLSYKFWPH